MKFKQQNITTLKHFNFSYHFYDTLQRIIYTPCPEILDLDWCWLHWQTDVQAYHTDYSGKCFWSLNSKIFYAITFEVYFLSQYRWWSNHNLQSFQLSYYFHETLQRITYKPCPKLLDLGWCRWYWRMSCLQHWLFISAEKVFEV